MPWVRANPSTQQTNTALIAAVTNKGVRVKQVYISSDTELTVTLVNGATHDVLWRQYVGARGGQAIPLGEKQKTGGMDNQWGEGIDYTTSAGGNVFLAVEYEYVGSG
jgi:hypothetical protein